jgi:hypothetical protein
VDYDVHHGNGTQQAFYEDDEVGGGGADRCSLVGLFLFFFVFFDLVGGVLGWSGSVLVGGVCR